MFAKDALEEIEQWRRQTTAPRHQLDWRWVERYRTLASFDSYWWLTAAGPFNEDEQEQWNSMLKFPLDEDIKKQLSTLIKQAQEREVMAAITEQREPVFHYPSLDIVEVRKRIADLQQLDTEICHSEPNAIVRRLYHETIVEELDFLFLIEATYEKNSQRFWEHNVRINPPPTSEEMEYAFSRVRFYLLHGLARTETKEISERIIQIVYENFHYTPARSYLAFTEQEVQKCHPSFLCHPLKNNDAW